MALSTAASLARDPNVAVALAASQSLASDSLNHHRFFESPTLEHTNVPTRLTGLCATPTILRIVLDALAVISATTAPNGNESIACALRLDPDHPTRPAVELILSSHEPVRKGTVRYFKTIWKHMLRISAVPNKRDVDREPFMRLLTTFRHTVYMHTLRKLRSDFAQNIAVIDHWKAQNVADNGELLVEFGCGDDARLRESLVETLLYLERCKSAFARMREECCEPKRLISSRSDFLLLVDAMERASQAADKLLMNTISLRVLSQRCFHSKHVLYHTFKSITSLPRHIIDLLHFAANHMESLHSHRLLLTVVSSVNISVPPWPKTNHQWEKIEKYIMKDAESFVSTRKRNDLRADNLGVHGELNLVTYIHALYFHSVAPTSLSTSGIPYPIHLTPLNYIAVTSPPCAPSALWIDTYNARHAARGDGLRFDIALDPFVRWSASTSGKHGWQWTPLPPIPDAGEEATEGVLKPIMARFGCGSREAEERIVAAAWEVYATMTRTVDTACSGDVLESQSVWGEPLYWVR
ncbi:hypothetical protein BDN70DRAFT_919388 [Pholiota conissans]|uniref:Uncharacterized protein n=1 Tax=Pholiota conissans TaxID=109636 RepID=A0A9P6D3X3_9AGAR|nr:hypothetical protein BDN70DRAFT_919388 [Pholiota conissans]